MPAGERDSAMARVITGGLIVNMIFGLIYEYE